MKKTVTKVLDKQIGLRREKEREKEKEITHSIHALDICRRNLFDNLINNLSCFECVFYIFFCIRCYSWPLGSHYRSPQQTFSSNESDGRHSIEICNACA